MIEKDIVCVEFKFDDQEETYKKYLTAMYMYGYCILYIKEELKKND